jgi:hypothetical protein
VILDNLPKRMTASQYVHNEVGGKAETICALLEEIAALRAMVAERDARIAELENPE